MAHNYYYDAREWPYKKVTPRIIIEKYMEDKEDMEEDYNDESVYDVNQIFKDLTRSLPKKNRYKATKIYQKAA